MTNQVSFVVQLNALEDRIAMVHREASSLTCVEAQSILSNTRKILDEIRSLRTEICAVCKSPPVSPIQTSSRIALSKAANHALKRAYNEND